MPINKVAVLSAESILASRKMCVDCNENIFFLFVSLWNKLVFQALRPVLKTRMDHIHYT